MASGGTPSPDAPAGPTPVLPTADDARFDGALAKRHRALADLHWTPASIVRTAAAWLVEAGARSVLDLGAGVGKFCTLASLAEPSLTCVGVEQRADLVRAAKAAARTLGATRTRFVHGGLEALAATPADALYLYNPFGENLEPDVIGIDRQVPLTPERYRSEVQAVEAFLAAAPAGHLLLTLNGFGGTPPPSYREQRHVAVGVDFLRLFRKGPARRRR